LTEIMEGRIRAAHLPPMKLNLPQEQVIAFLSDPASYGLTAGKIKRVDTHCSIVFLAGRRAYKLKRAIRYASLDYRTRALRQAACEAELRLNRRTAPDLYLGVLAITASPAGQLSFGGSFGAVEHVVVMRRFPQSALFDRMVATGKATPALMRELGAAVASFHLAADPAPSFGGSRAIARVIAVNDRELAKVAATLDGAAVDDLSRLCRAELAAVAPLLDRRRREGKVRRCHGDLRLANICLYRGHPTLFDCVDFSEEIGCIDVLYDVAFLLMDLLSLGRGDLAETAFGAYLERTPQPDGLRALPLFLALRAATRSYALAGLAGRQSKPQQAARLRELARRHIAAGIDYLARRRDEATLWACQSLCNEPSMSGE
jgi:aminoglycoside phosphotransferase family enzyme